jgi:nucleotide-binding universal stress UspA family protein
MSQIRSYEIDKRSVRSGGARHVEAAKTHLEKVLAVVDNTELCGHVLECLIALADRTPIEVVVLNVQPAPETSRLRGYGSFKLNEIHSRLVDDLARPLVRSMARRLALAGIPSRERIELGDSVATVLRCAGEEHSDLIMIGEPHPSCFRRWLARTLGISFGSIAINVAQLAEVPVTIVK